MFTHFLFFFSFLLLNHVKSLRSDYASAISESSVPWSIDSSDLQASFYCPANSWAAGFNTFGDCTTNGIVYFQLACLTLTGTQSSTIYNTETGDWSDSSWQFTPGQSTNRFCESDHFFVGFKEEGKCCSIWENDLGMSGIILDCSSGTTIRDGGNCANTWGSDHKCNGGTAICGFTYKFNSYQQLTDNTAVEDIGFSCCKICSPSSSVYASGASCPSCDMNCLTCSSSATTCSSCGRSDTLNSGHCDNDATQINVVEEFKGSTSSAFQTDYNNNGWSGGFSFLQVGSWYMLGKYGYGKTIVKTLSNMVPHFKARLKVRYYKLDSWNGEGCHITIDGSLQSVSSITGWQGVDTLHNLYWGDLNSATGYENTLFVDIEFVHNSPTMTIQFSSTLTSSGSAAGWGISNVGVYAFRCHPSCKTCSGGSLSTQCLTCYADAALTSSSTCECNDKFWADTTSPCTTNICTVCRSCNTGCLKCTGSGATQCTYCDTGYYFYNNQCYQVCPTSPNKFGDPATLTCIDSCQADEYYDAIRICLKCSSVCYRCSGSASYCTACTGNRYLESNDCVTMCSPNHYGVYSSHTCEADCEDDYFKHAVDRLCYQRCPSGYFGNMITKFCTSVCPDGMYSDPLTVLCQYCDFNCGKCTGSADSCDSCKYSWLKSDSSCSNPACFFYKNPSFFRFFDSFLDTNTLTSQIFTTNPMSNTDVTSSGFTLNSPESSTYANTCANNGISYYVVGGYGTLSSGTITGSYSSLQAHFSARVTLFFLKIDDWNNNKVIVRADGIDISPGLSFSATDDSSIMKLCGQSAKTEALRPVDIVFAHTSMSLALEITSDLTGPATQASWGIFDLSVYIYLCNSAYCKTCSGPLETDCLSCPSGLYLQTSPGPSTCEALCPDGFYQDIVNNVCPACHSSCKTCSGALPTNCLSCFTGKLLIISGADFTCGDCPAGTWASDSDICMNCDPNCVTCSAGSYKDCLSCIGTKYFYDGQCWVKCKDGTVGVNSTMTCELDCPSGTFANAGTNTCWSCYDSHCVKCIGMSENQCSECGQGFYWQDGYCVSECAEDHYRNDANSSCDRCAESCQKCSGLLTCEKCSDGLFIRIPLNVSCSTCEDKGEFANESSQTCVECQQYCEVCETSSTCKECQDGYFLTSSKTCIPQKALQVVLKASSSDPSLVYLVFTDRWERLFTSLNDVTSILITNHSENDYTYSLAGDENLDNQMDLAFQFKTDILMGDVLYLNIDFPDDPNDEFLLKDKNLTLAMSMYCVSPRVYLLVVGTCVDLISITPSLRLTTKDTTLCLEFGSGYGTIYSTYKSSSRISIQNMNSTVFNYSINASSSPEIFYVYLNFSISFSNHPQLILSLSPPNSVLYDQTTNLRLTTYELSVNLADHYQLDSSTENLISQTGTATDSMNTISKNAFAANNLLNSGASFGIRSLVSMDIIRFLRFFEIDYPPNVLAMFQTSMPTSDLIPNINLEEDPEDGQLPDIFQEYELSIYLFNNNGNTLLEAFTYMFTGVVILLLLRAFKDTSNTYFKMVLLVSRMIFVWNYALSYFLSAFTGFALSTFLAFRYPTSKTNIGRFNFAFSVLTGFFIAGILVFCFKVISKVRAHVVPSKSSVFPENNTPKEIEISPENQEISSKRTSIKEGGKTYDKETAGFTKIKVGETDRIFQPLKVMEETPPSDDNLSQRKVFGQESPSKGNPLDQPEISLFSKLRRRQKNDLDITVNDIEPISEIQFPVQSPSDTILEAGSPEKSAASIENPGSDQLKAPPMLVISPSENKEKPLFPFIFRKLSRKLGFGAKNLPYELENERKNGEKRANAKPETVGKGGDFEGERENHELFHRSFFPLHKDFKQSKSSQSYYILFDMVRQILFSSLVVGLFDQPLTGILIVNIFNLCYFVAFLTIRPFKGREDFIQGIINEVCLLICSLCTLVLVSMQKANLGDLELKIKIGWVMVAANSFLILVFLLRIFASFAIMIFVLLRFGGLKLLRWVRGRNKVMDAKARELERKKTQGAVLQQIIEIENFLR